MRDHCWTSVAARAHNRLKTKLKNQSALMVRLAVWLFGEGICGSTRSLELTERAKMMATCAVRLALTDAGSGWRDL